VRRLARDIVAKGLFARGEADPGDGELMDLDRARTFGSTLLSTVLVALAAAAQEEPQPILTAQLSFSNPGARSLGLGGAFVALADDATAAWANPAGLVQIARPEVSLEGRHWRYSTPFVARGRIEGEPTGFGLDTIAGLRTETSNDNLSDLAFLSFVYPRNRWSVAVYRHVLANLEATAETRGIFAGRSQCCPQRFLDQRNRSNLEIASYGSSGAYRITDSFSLGLGLVYYDGSLQTASDLYVWDEPEDFLGSVTSYLPERFVVGQTLFVDDRSLGFTGGFLWRISSHWSLGGKYRQGPEFDFEGRALIGPALDLGFPPGTEIVLDLGAQVDFPDNYGLGAAYRSGQGRLTMAFEWDRVTYSDPLDSLGVDDQDIDDADELHLGGEWALLEMRPLLAVRVGVWLDPDHQTRANERANDFTRALLQPGEDEMHYAVGLGVALKNFQLDGAIDFSDSVKTASLSAILSF
jgi:long-subunit fatty acid transport protein